MSTKLLNPEHEPRQAIVRRHLHDRLLTELREMIASGDLKAGEKIPEKLLCERFQVSRTPLREALKVLAFEGFVKLKPNHGAVISTVTLADIAESFPVMGMVEALAGELACQRITDDEIRQIRALHTTMLGHFQRQELQPYFSINQEIHESIQRAARNETLYAIYRSLAGRVRCARLIANIAEDRWAEAVGEHEQIIAALEARDGAALSGILRVHIANKFKTLEKSLSAGDILEA